MQITTRRRQQRGFSLIELLVAMAITLIVTGSIYGLLAQSQNAFRREPEISDRQQQIRVAMDLIQRDLATAGMGMPEWGQAFTQNLDGLGPNNAQGLPTDFLEMIGSDGGCASVTLCGAPVGPTIQTNDPLPACYRITEPIPVAMLVMTRPGFNPGVTGASIGLAIAATGAPGIGCFGDTVTVTPIPPGPPGQLPYDIPGGAVGAAPPPGDMKPVQIVRYEIVADAAGIPSLWRSPRGGLGPALTYVAPGNPGAGWQLVAVGIEDLQVEYKTAVAGWSITPPPVDDTVPLNDYTTLVTQVKVTLGARTTGQANLQGQSDSVAGVSAIRGELTSVTAPRAALFALSIGPPLGDAARWE